MACSTPSLGLYVDNVGCARRGDLAARFEYVAVPDTVAQSKRLFLGEISCAKGTPSGGGPDRAEDCLRMGGAGLPDGS